VGLETTMKVLHSVPLALALLCVAGCDKRLADPPVPQAQVKPDATAKPLPSPPDPSLPAAGSVLTPPTTATAKDEAGTRPRNNLTREEESAAMPKPGQVNNHSSTALDSHKGASAP
jgi:hypothetical protein